MSTEDKSELLDHDIDHLADAEVLVTELLKDSRRGTIKKAVDSVLTTAEEGVGELRHLYERKPYHGLFLAGCIGLALGLLFTRKSD